MTMDSSTATNTSMEPSTATSLSSSGSIDLPQPMDLLSVFEKAIPIPKDWSCPIIMFLYTSSKPNIPSCSWYDPSKPIEDPVEFDLTASLGQHQFRGGAFKSDYTKGAFFLPPHLNSDDKNGKPAAMQFVQKACAESLVEVVGNGYRGGEGNCHHRLLHQYFICRYGRKKSVSKGNKVTQQDRSVRPNKDEVCHFKFRMFFDPDDKCWFFPNQQKGNRCHNFHRQKTSKAAVHLSTKMIDPSQMQIVMQQLACHFSVSQIAKWFSVATDYSLSSNQITSLNKQLRAGLYSHESLKGLGFPSNNSIEAMLEYIRGDERCVSLWITSSKETAKSHISVKMTKKRKERDAKVIEDRSLVETPWEYISPDPHPNEETPLTFTERTLKTLSVGDSGRCLLSLAWADRDSITALTAFPFILGMDETEGTNCEERPLFTVVGLTRDNKIIPVVHVFMPSKARWSYTWIYTKVIPYLLPKELREKVCMIITDQGKELVHQLEATRHLDVFPNCRHRLCLWHIVNRNFHMEVIKRICDKTTKQGMIDNIFVSSIERWMYSFGSVIETEGEEKAHMSHLKSYIEAFTDVTDSVRTFTRDFVTKSFEPLLPKICFRHYMFLPFGDTKVSSFVESYNGVMATSKTGPKPNHSLVTAFTRILDDCRRRFTSRQASMEKNLHRSLTLKSGTEKEKSTYIEIQNHAADHLSRHLTAKSVQRIVKQWTLASRYIAVERPPNDVNVQRQFFVCRHPELPPQIDAVVPTWRHTRVVDVVLYDSSKFLRCSCGHANRTGVPCRHIYSILVELPRVNQCTCQCWKEYELNYARDDHFTATIDQYSSYWPTGFVPIFDETVGVAGCAGYFIPMDQELSPEVLNYLKMCVDLPVLEVGSAAHIQDDAPQDIIMETSGIPPMKTATISKSGDEVSTLTSESLTSFTSSDEPVLTSTPQKYNAPDASLERLPNESEKAHLMRIKDLSRRQLLNTMERANTVNEITHCYKRMVHLQAELDLKHAAEDPYGTIRDNVGGTLSAAIPRRQPHQKKRLKKQNEVRQSKSKKNK